MADVAAGHPEAARDVLATLTSGPAATDAYVGLGLINEKLGDPAAALAAYRHALELDPQNFAAKDGQTRTAGAVASPADAGGS
jgi:predicted TPR repeat methyltransferase